MPASCSSPRPLAQTSYMGGCITTGGSKVAKTSSDSNFNWSRIRPRLAVHGLVDKAVAQEVFVHPGGHVNLVVCRRLVLAPNNIRTKPEVNVAVVFDKVTLMDGKVGTLHATLKTVLPLKLFPSRRQLGLERYSTGASWKCPVPGRVCTARRTASVGSAPA